MKKILSIILLVIIVILGGCKPKEPEIGFRTLRFVTFGNIPVDVTIIDDEKKLANSERLETLWNDINDIITRIDDVFSINHPEESKTIIQTVNENSGIKAIEVPEEVIYLLKEAIGVSELSIIGGKAQYDVTIAPLWEAWEFIEYNQTINKATIPTEEQLQQLVNLVDYRKIIIDEDESTVYLTEKGMGLDLGSIAKGYAADEVRDYLLSKGISRGMVNVGGNLITMGESYWFKEKKNIPWDVMITTPYQLAGVGNKYYIGSFKETDVTVVTSGVYERYYEVDGIDYHHILDTVTGYPRDSGLLSLSIVTDNSMLADAFSTTVFSLGLKEGFKLVEKTPGMEAIAITIDKDIYITSGLKDKFTFNENVGEIGYIYGGVYKE